MKNFTILYKTLYLLVFLIILSGFSGIELTAGNIKMGPIAWPTGYIDFNETKSISAKIENNNPSYSVTGLTWKWTIFDVSTNLSVYSDESTGTDVKANEKKDITLKPLDWSKLSAGLSYRVELTFTADYDADPSDNKSSSNFSVNSNNITRTQAQDLSTTWFRNRFPMMTYPNRGLFLSNSVIPAGTNITYDTYETGSTLLGKPSYIGVANGNVFQIDPVALEWFSVDAANGEIKTYSTDWLPRINGVSFPNTEAEEISSLVFGKYNTPVKVNESDWIFDATNETSNSAPCILIVTGKPANERERTSFLRSPGIVRQEFQKEKWGSRIPDGSIEVLNNPTAVDLMDKIESMKGKCSKFIFYYIGHGDSLTGMVLNDETMPFKNLFNLVFEQSFSSNFFVFDCCFSGLALEEITQATDYQTKNVTVLTSCGRDVRSNLRFLTVKKPDGTEMETGIPSFTNALFTTLGNSTANLDKDLEVSIKEGFDATLLRNPLVTDKEKFNDFNPGIFTNENHQASSSNISFPDNDVDIKINSGLNMNHSISVRCDRGANLFSQPSDNSIYSVSDKRIFNINLMGNSSGFNVDVSFRVNPAWDDLSGTDGVPGMIWRENNDSEWKPYYPSTYNSSDKLILVGNLQHFSQWAFARISPTSDVFDFPGSDGIEVLYGNYIPDYVSFRFRTDNSSLINADLYNINGSKILNISNCYLNQGIQTIGFNKSGLNAGVYFVKFQINERTVFKKILIY